MARLSVILPTYNERENIKALILAISHETNPAPEILVVDDDSPDKTWEVVAELRNQIPLLRLHRRLNVRGLATAIAEGITLSTGDVLTWMDSDLSHPTTLLPQMLTALDDYDIVIASRYVRGGRQKSPLIRAITSRSFNLYANLWLGFSVKDWTSGFAVIKREVLEKVKLEPMGQGYGEYFIGFLFRALEKGFKVKEIPYTYIYNNNHNNHETKTSPTLLKLLTFGISYGLCVLQLRWKALRGKL